MKTDQEIDEDYTAFSPIPDYSNKSNQKINLLNFDPFNKRLIINSPRSLKACSKHGIQVYELYHKSFEEIRRIL